MSNDCYMCDAPSVSREHAPPFCFFPEGYRRNLLTVPSCEAHNSRNSKDVEYVRNVISAQHGTNEVAALIFESAKRSFERSPRLRQQTFRDLSPVQVQGQELGAFSIDLSRHKNVMAAIAYALYFRSFGKKHRGDWQIFTPSFKYAATVRRGAPDPWNDFRTYLEFAPYVDIPVSEPRVFKYGLAELEQNQIAFRFEFYESVVVVAWTLFRTYVAF